MLPTSPAHDFSLEIFFNVRNGKNWQLGKMTLPPSKEMEVTQGYEISTNIDAEFGKNMEKLRSD